MRPRHRHAKRDRSLVSGEKLNPPRTSDSDRNRTPVWLAGRMDFDGPWCWKKMDVEALHRVHARLSAFERMTFGEIEGRHNHQIPIEQLAKQARDRLYELGIDDYDSVLSLRITKVERVWGLKDPFGVFLLWWDPDHSVYPMNIADN